MEGERGGVGLWRRKSDMLLVLYKEHINDIDEHHHFNRLNILDSENIHFMQIETEK